MRVRDLAFYYNAKETLNDRKIADVGTTDMMMIILLFSFVDMKIFIMPNGPTLE